MLERLAEVKQRFEEISHLILDPNVINNNEQYRELMKEYKNLSPIVEKYDQYISAENEFKEAKELLNESGTEQELKEIAQLQYDESKSKLDKYSEELKFMLLPKDENDNRSVIIEIRGGAGGEEAALFAYSLYRMYKMYAETKGWNTDIISSNETELGGFKEVSFSIEGDDVYSRFKFESGVHRVQRVPDTEAQGRIHTSTVTVAVMAEVDEVEVEINPKDLRIDTFRSSGAGGQHINKTSSAIRVTHIPTGLVVECQDERSQYKNKEKALKVLRSRLYEMEKTKQEAEVAKERRSQVGSGDRSERIRTYNYPQGRVTDHRLGLTLYKLEQFLNGDLDEMIDALVMADQTEKLKMSGDLDNEN